MERGACGGYEPADLVAKNKQTERKGRETEKKGP